MEYIRCDICAKADWVNPVNISIAYEAEQICYFNEILNELKRSYAGRNIITITLNFNFSKYTSTDLALDKSRKELKIKGAVEPPEVFTGNTYDEAVEFFAPFKKKIDALHTQARKAYRELHEDDADYDPMDVFF